MRPNRVKLIFGAVLLLSIISLTDKSVFGQLTKIENKLPKIVPLEVEFKNYHKENWWHDLEIKVTNTGKKPIYYLSMYLWLDATYPESGGPESGKPMAISFDFGDLRRFFSSTNGETAALEDPAILPGESYTFRVPDNYVKGYDLRKKLGSFNEPREAQLEHGWTNFGDDTGILPGGTPWRTPLKKAL